MSIQQDNKFQAIISHAKEYGFVFPSSEIYDGLSAVYDYGPNGSELKKNIRDYWWKSMTQLHENIVGIDAAIFMHPTTWKASGHVDNFRDPMIDNRDSQKRYRVDHLIEAKADALKDKGEEKAAEALLAQMDQLLAAEDYTGLKQLIADQKIVCSISGTGNWTDIRQFNLMFSTQLGSVAEEADTIYLRPETAQGIFVNFLNVQKTARMKIPFGIAQTGKAFRNEIVARQFISACASLNRWKCSSSSAPVHKRNGITTGKRPVCNGTSVWVSRQKNTATTITLSWPTMPTQRWTLNTNFLLGLRKWKASTAVQILT